MLTLAALLALQDAWWDPAWTLRRTLTVRNGGERAAPAGLPMEIEVDPDFLNLDDRNRPVLSVVRAGARLPHLLLPSAAGLRWSLNFTLAAGIPPGRTDAYALYYGNPAGTAPLVPAGLP